MKYLLSAFAIALIGSCGAVFAQEVELINQATQQGLDVHVGETDLPMQPSQFNVRDASGNLVTSVPFLSGGVLSTLRYSDHRHIVHSDAAGRQ
jgi:hypothetical protein